MKLNQLYLLNIFAFLASSSALWNDGNKKPSSAVQLKRKLRSSSFTCTMFVVDYMSTAYIEYSKTITSGRRAEEVDDIPSKVACVREDGETYEINYNGESDIDSIVQSPLIGDNIKSGKTVIKLPVSYVMKKITFKGEDSSNPIIDLSSIEEGIAQVMEVGGDGSSTTTGISTRGVVKRIGDSRVAVIRVETADGSPSKTAGQLSDDIFGTAEDQYNLQSGYKSCSGNKLNFYPGEENDLVDGVRTITLSQSSSGVSSSTVQSWTNDKLTELGFPSSAYDHVMYIFPQNVNFGGAAAYAYIWGSLSVYWNTYGSTYLVLIHEIGHNLGHYHSGEGSASYGDRTCWMGAHIYEDEGPAACFNGAKSWWLGWYADRHIEVAPSTEAAELKLAGIDDYLQGQTTEDEHNVIMRLTEGTDDLYVMYNRAKGVNAGVAGSPDKVTIVEQPGDAAQSWFQAALGAEETYTKTNWAGSGKTLVVSVCAINSGTPDYASVIAYVQGETFASCDGSTQSPTAAPTPCQDETIDVTLQILTDMYGYETSWTLEDADSGALIASDSDLNNSQLYDYTYNLCSAQCYKFKIMDSYGDGIFATQGHYDLSINDEVVATSKDNENGNFGNEESFEFCGDDYVSPPGSPTSSPTSEPTDTPTSSPTLKPTDEATSSPTQEPTTAPTSTPTSTPTSAPTDQLCLDDIMTVGLELRTDAWGGETSWALTNVDTGTLVASVAASSLGSREDYEYTYDLCSTWCYNFTIADAYGDGIYSSHEGYYTFSVNGVVVAESGDNEGGNFGYEESIQFCGSDTDPPTSVPSSSPTSSPTDSPTSSPTDSPTSSPTGSPTSSQTTFSPTSSQTTFSPTGSQLTFSPTDSLSGEPTSSECDFEVTLQLLTDRWAYETSWSLNNVDDGTVVASNEYNFADKEMYFEYPFCLQSACYEFDMKDAYGDGIVDSHAGGKAGYNFTVNGEILASSDNDDNGDFDFEESVTFGCVSPPPPPSNCADGEFDVTLELNTDNWAYETSWTLENMDNREMIDSVSYEISDEITLFEYQYCVPSSACYVFVINDSFGDGIADSGSYSLSVDSEVIDTSLDDELFDHQKVSYFGSCNFE